MARGIAKTVTLTADDKLKQALVPESEQPYQVPENWCWTQLGHVAYHISDGSHNPPKDSGTGIPLLSAMNIHDRIIDIDATVRWITDEQWETENKRTKIERNDVLLTIVATIGRTAVVKNEKFALQRSVAVIKPKINSEFLSYYFDSPYIQEFMNGNAKGTAQKGFYLNSLEKLYCCLPPLAEQLRIVDRIESLFAKMDEARDKVQEVLDGFETRKAAILQKAFTGELTAKWRKAHGVGMESWEKVNFESVSNAIDPQPSHRTPPENKDGIPYIGIAECNYQTLDIDFDNARKVSRTVLEEHLNRYQIMAGDFIIGKIGTIGKPFMIPAEQTYALSANIVLIQPSREKVYSAFLFYQFKTSFIEKQFQAGVKATTQAAFGIQKVRNMTIILPCMLEQQEIVRILVSLLAKEQQAKEAAEAVLEQINLVKKSILARAFRGELGTNDPTEESAMELLKTVL